MITIDLKTQPGNPREVWQARSGRVKRERAAVAKALQAATRPPIPCTVLLTRVAPSGGLDEGDNLASALKGVRDEVATWIGVNDRDQRRVRYLYAQTRGPWGVRIDFGGPASGAQMELLGETILPPLQPSEARA